MPPAIDRGITPDRPRKPFAGADALPTRGPNPFSSEHSGYGHFVNGSFVSSFPPGSEMFQFHTQAQRYVQGKILDKSFPCILGQAAVRTEQYAFSAYDDITQPDVAEGVLHDIVLAQHELEIPTKKVGKRGIFRSTLAAFRKPVIEDEMHGAEVLYTLLQNMHEKNSQHYDWTEGFSNELDSLDFGYAAGESAHFIAFFHPEATVPARVSEVQFIVFNSYHVINAFKELKGMEHHARVKEIIRSRQVQPIHPYLGNHGDVLEWVQYPLLSPDPDTEAKELELRNRILGECPFQPHPMRAGEEIHFDGQQK